MLEHSQFHVKPGAYEHYKTNADGSHPIYVVENIITHHQQEGVWVKLQDPFVVYRNLDQQFENINGTRTWVIKTFMRPLSEFTSDVEVNGQLVKRFKPI